MKKSFTLIELLVVIAIIGILAAMILASISNLRARARDARRKSDLAQLYRALSLYYQDNNEKYPTSLNDLVPNYIKKLPHDPKYSPDHPEFGYFYTSDPDRRRFWLFVKLEKPQHQDSWWMIYAGSEGKGREFNLPLPPLEISDYSPKPSPDSGGWIKIGVGESIVFSATFNKDVKFARWEVCGEPVEGGGVNGSVVTLTVQPLMEPGRCIVSVFAESQLKEIAYHHWQMEAE